MRPTGQPGDRRRRRGGQHVRLRFRFDDPRSSPGNRPEEVLDARGPGRRRRPASWSAGGPLRLQRRDLADPAARRSSGRPWSGWRRSRQGDLDLARIQRHLRRRRPRSRGCGWSPSSRASTCWAEAISLTGPIGVRGLRGIEADQAAPRPLPQEDGPGLEGRRLSLSARPTAGGGRRRRGAAAGRGARAPGAPHRHQRGQPAVRARCCRTPGSPASSGYVPGGDHPLGRFP